MLKVNLDAWSVHSGDSTLAELVNEFQTRLVAANDKGVTTARLSLTMCVNSLSTIQRISFLWKKYNCMCFKQFWFGNPGELKERQ